MTGVQTCALPICPRESGGVLLLEWGADLSQRGSHSRHKAENDFLVFAEISAVEFTDAGEIANVILRSEGGSTVRLREEAAQNSTRYFTDWVLPQLDLLLPDNDQPIEVWTTLDPTAQRAATEAIQANVPKGSQGALVSLDRDGAVLRITIHRPERRNAMNEEVCAGIAAAIDVAESTPGVRVVVLTGTGRVFCAGADVSAGAGAFDTESGAGAKNFGSRSGAREDSDFIAAMMNSTKPLLVAYNGSAAGVGLTLTLPCDIRIAADTARFGCVFTRRGLVPEAGSAWFLPRLVGLATALKWCMTGALVPATEALAAGLVSELVPAEQVEVRARASGYLQGVHFRDGQTVKRGDLLFTLDPRPAQAQLAAARALLAQAQAQVGVARTEFARSQSLLDATAISREEFESKRAIVAQAEAQVQSAQAAVQARTLDLEFTRVTAPISGLVSERRVDAGNVVSGGASTGDVLTTIVSTSPIHFAFDASEAVLLKYRRGGGGTGRVQVRLQDESDYRWAGRLDFTDNAKTGIVDEKFNGDSLGRDFLELDGLVGRQGLVAAALFRIGEGAAIGLDALGDRAQELALPFGQGHPGLFGGAASPLDRVQRRAFGLAAGIEGLGTHRRRLSPKPRQTAPRKWTGAPVLRKNLRSRRWPTGRGRGSHLLPGAWRGPVCGSGPPCGGS